jgi:ring-1,2-phenylacetyl-CoA epoxidase subunit PaaC
MEKNSLFEYCLRIGDSSLVIGHRLSEWCGHGPILEEDIAMTNISLDLIGQARIMLTYAGQVEGKNRSEDDLAYLRDAMDFRNLLITEQHNGDFGKTMMRQFFFSAYCYFLYQQLTKSKDSTIAAFAEKSLKEVTYHVRHSADWIVRLGDGTEESHTRAQEAADELWAYTGEMFDADAIDQELQKSGIGADLSKVKEEWTKLVTDIFKKATLKLPVDGYMQKGSKQGKHSEHLGYLLAEMQFLPRAYPGASW